jgi:endoglucanase
MDRRDFLKTTVLGTAAALTGRAALAAPESGLLPLHKKLPRWRGFNLMEKMNAGRNMPFIEADFQWLADWGFDFVRLPMDYRCWTDPNDPYKADEKVLAEIDLAVEMGRKHKVHVDLALHRAPGYTVAKPP